MNSNSITVRRWKAWGRDAGERAVKTVAQTAVALLSTDSLGLVDFGSTELWSASVAAGLLSLLTSLASKPTGNPSSAGLFDGGSYDDV